MLCTPAIVYLVIGILSLIWYFTQYSFGTVLFKAIFVGLWTWLLNFICSRGYTYVSWILVLLPIILLILLPIIFVAFAIGYSNK